MSKLAFSVLVVFITLNAACTQGNEENGGITLPDYSDWEISLDHSESYLYKGEPVSLFDKHYGFRDMVTVVFYHPETEKEWIAFHAVYSEDGRRDYLFEKNGDKWDFFMDVSGIKDMSDIFKERYNLVPTKPY